MTALPVIPEQNNIGALRLLFALIVVAAHASALSLAPALTGIGAHVDSMMAVQGFFVLSGFLVVMSYEKSRGLRDYAAKRLRRIYPAYATVILCAAFLGVFVSQMGWQDYFGIAWLRYVFSNLLFLNFAQQNLPGVFAKNPINAVDGALWTIKIEVCFYALVPLLVWLLRSRFRLPWMGVIYLGSQLYMWGCTYLAVATGHDYFLELGRQLPGQLAFFISGAALYYYQAWVQQKRTWLMPIALAMFLFTRVTGCEIFYPMALGLLVMGIAFAPYFGNSERFGDLSYGLYIWHFPIIQLLVAFGFFAASAWGAFAAAFVLPLCAALLSWHGVEKRWLRRTSHYRVVT